MDSSAAKTKANPPASSSANADDIFRTFGRLVFDLSFRLDAIEKQTVSLHRDFVGQLTQAYARIEELERGYPGISSEAAHGELGA